MKNLGYLTDAIFHRLDGEVTDRGDYYLVRTPSNPTYFWGNYLLFKSKPHKGCFDHWMKIHEEEFGPDPGHIAIGWDTYEKGDFSDFLDHGFKPNEDLVLCLTGPPNQVRLNPDLEVRKFATDEDWQASIDGQIAEGFYSVSKADYRIFKTDQMANHRLNQERGKGNWWGAFLDGELVGDMGIYFDQEEKIARFQNVGTAKAHRRKRVCSTLLDQVIKNTIAEEDIERLVIVAEHGSIAETIYRSFGFVEDGLQWGVYWHTGLGST